MTLNVFILRNKSKDFKYFFFLLHGSKARKESEINSLDVDDCCKLKVTLFELFKVDITTYIQVGQFQRRSAFLRLIRGS